MQQAVSIFISQFVAEGDQVGMVAFSTKADILSYLVQVNGQADRDALLKHIPTAAEGSTCIGCGINSAITVKKYFYTFTTRLHTAHTIFIIASCIYMFKFFFFY